MQPQPCLSHMPFLVKAMIVESLPMEFRERAPLRILSKAFKEVVDSSNMKMSLSIQLLPNQIGFEHGNRLLFSENDGSCTVIGKQVSTVPRDFEDVAFDYFKFFASKPKLVFENFKITNFEQNEDFEIREFIKKFQEIHSARKLKVQHFTFVTLLKTERDIMNVVPYLDDELLVSMDLKGDTFTHYQELPETAQWNNLKKLATDVSVLSMLSLKSYCHIPRLVIRRPSGQNDWTQWTISFYKNFMYANSALESVTMDAALFNQALFNIQEQPDWTLMGHRMNWLIVDRSKEICLCFNYDNYPDFKVKKWTWEQLKAIEENNNDN